MHVALVGTRGVPASYGGFETCVEEVGARFAAAGHDVTVYCRRGADGSDVPPPAYRGMRLVQLPALRRRSLETLSHTALSVGHLLLHPRPDVVVLFNAANSPFLPALRLRRVPVATHVDGLEWRRGKWGTIGRKYYRLAESLGVRWSDVLIADAEGIRDYYEAEFGAPSELIRYGAPLITNGDPGPLESLGLHPRRYHLIVARVERENHVDVIVEGYVRSRAQDPLVVVGSAPYANDYGQEVAALADDRVRFLGSIWDQDLLNALYSNALAYYHGHSVGGTNPSLLRAAGAAAATNAYDVGFNREVLGVAGRYWRNADDVARLVDEAESDRAATIRRGEQGQQRALAYDWDDVAAAYETMCERLISHELRRSGATGRRRRPGWDGR